MYTRTNPTLQELWTDAQTAPTIPKLWEVLLGWCLVSVGHGMLAIVGLGIASFGTGFLGELITDIFSIQGQAAEYVQHTVFGVVHGLLTIVSLGLVLEFFTETRATLKRRARAFEHLLIAYTTGVQTDTCSVELPLGPIDDDDAHTLSKTRSARTLWSISSKHPTSRERFRIRSKQRAASTQTILSVHVDPNNPKSPTLRTLRAQLPDATVDTETKGHLTKYTATWSDPPLTHHTPDAIQRSQRLFAQRMDRVRNVLEPLFGTRAPNAKIKRSTWDGHTHPQEPRETQERTGQHLGLHALAKAQPPKKLRRRRRRMIAAQLVNAAALLVIALAGIPLLGIIGAFMYEQVVPFGIPHFVGIVLAFGGMLVWLNLDHCKTLGFNPFAARGPQFPQPISKDTLRLEGSVLWHNEQSIDLNAPFSLQWTQAHAPDDDDATLGVHVAQGQTRITFRVPVQPSPWFDALPSLQSNAPTVDGADFDRWIQPTLTNVHNLHETAPSPLHATALRHASKHA